MAVDEEPPASFRAPADPVAVKVTDYWNGVYSWVSDAALATSSVAEARR